MIEEARKLYSLWQGEILSPELKRELDNIRENDEEICDRFCRQLTFGTSGIRGKMGVGTNRINPVVIERVTRGIGKSLLDEAARPAVAISYDTRLNSREYANLAAETFASLGITAYITQNPEPVPMLSFAIRELGLSGGVMITASHNPREFNGYKVYDEKGSQIGEEKARLMEAYIEREPYFVSSTEKNPQQRNAEGYLLEEADRRAGQILTMPEEIGQRYLEQIALCLPWWTDDKAGRQEAMGKLAAVYTPLNGAGRDRVLELFSRIGLSRVKTVERQCVWDGYFRTCPSPNPESRDAFNEALLQTQDNVVDVIIATDPDCDRMGAMAYDGDVYVHLSGNQIGILILDYLCSCSNLQIEGKYIYKSLVRTPLADKIAKAHGAKAEDTLTGFKNIAAKMELLAEAGSEDQFLFGFEESSGFLYGTYTRDKDGVMAAQLICLAAAKCKADGIDLPKRLSQIYGQYGVIEERNHDLRFHMEADRKKIENLMNGLFEGELETVAGLDVEIDRQYKESQVFQGRLRASDGKTHRFAIRPSGTELKLKTYIFAEGESRKKAGAMAD